MTSTSSKLTLADFDSSSTITHHLLPDERLFLVTHSENGKGVFSAATESLIVPCGTETVNISPIETLVTGSKVLWLVTQKDETERVYASAGKRCGRIGPLIELKKGWKLDRALSDDILLLWVESSRPNRRYRLAFLKSGSNVLDFQTNWTQIHIGKIIVRPNRDFIIPFQRKDGVYPRGHIIFLINSESETIENYTFGQ